LSTKGLPLKEIIRKVCKLLRKLCGYSFQRYRLVGYRRKWQNLELQFLFRSQFPQYSDVSFNIADFFISLSQNMAEILFRMNRIKEVLTEKGIKQTWLAEQLGKSFSVVNAYVCNRRQPSLEVLFDIAKILQVNPKDLIESKK